MYHLIARFLTSYPFFHPSRVKYDNLTVVTHYEFSAGGKDIRMSLYNLNSNKIISIKIFKKSKKQEKRILVRCSNTQPTLVKSFLPYVDVSATYSSHFQN